VCAAAAYLPEAPHVAFDVPRDALICGSGSTPDFKHASVRGGGLYTKMWRGLPDQAPGLRERDDWVGRVEGTENVPVTKEPKVVVGAKFGNLLLVGPHCRFSYNAYAEGSKL